MQNRGSSLLPKCLNSSAETAFKNPVKQTASQRSNASLWPIASTLLSILDPNPQLVRNKTTEKIFTIKLETNQIKTFWISRHKIKNCAPKLFIFDISLCLICEYSFHKPNENIVLTPSQEFFTTVKPLQIFFKEYNII